MRTLILVIAVGIVGIGSHVRADDFSVTNRHPQFEVTLDTRTNELHRVVIAMVTGPCGNIQPEVIDRKALELQIYEETAPKPKDDLAILSNDDRYWHLYTPELGESTAVNHIRLKRKVDRFESHRFVAQFFNQPDLTFSAGVIPRDAASDLGDEKVVGGIRLRWELTRRLSFNGEFTIPKSKQLKKENGNGPYLFVQYQF